MVVKFSRGAESTVATCPLHGIAFEYRQHTKTFCICHDVPPNFNLLAWLLPRDLWSKKARTVQVRALWALRRRVTCGNGDGV